MNHPVDELFLAASLDDTWQTPLAIKREFKILGEAQRPSTEAACLGALAE
jgi:hypothetical protein